MNVVVVGYGEIGRAVSALYDGTSYSVYPIDIDLEVLEQIDVDVMHICIPFNKDFVENVVGYYRRFRPTLTVINSTVKVGTTKMLYDKTDGEFVMSPCMGVHPDLSKSMKTFKKIIGSETETARRYAIEHFAKLGIKCKAYSTAATAELAKLASTTRYANEIMFLQDLKLSCDRYGLNIDEVYGDTTKIYNDGYKEMGLEKFTRPQLEYMGDTIGGHCLVPNAKILLDLGIMERITGHIIKRGNTEHVTQNY